jgi:ABC-type antimicrobial peptide transport system permease subunit
MKANQKFQVEEQGNIEMITMGIVAAVTFAIAIPIVFNVIGSIDITTANDNIKTNVYGLSPGADPTDDNNRSWAEWNNTQPVGNATNSLLVQVNSFFSIGPIYLVVVVAVGIIAAILVLRRFA